MDTPRSDYIHSLDALRAFAAFAVVSLHTQPFQLSGYFPPDELCCETAVGLNVLALFAVPFFFAAAGYFMGCSAAGGKSLGSASLKTMERAFAALVFWSAIYIVLPSMEDVFTMGLFEAVRSAVESSWNSFSRHPDSLLLNGGSYQLWFLSSLIQAAAVVWIFEKIGMDRWLVAIALGLYCFGLLGQSYGALFHLDMDLNTRTGPFFALLPFVLGYRLASGRAWSARNSTLLAVFGMVLMFTEVWATRDYNAGTVEHYYIGSIPLALGLLMAALGSPLWASGTIWPHLGRMSLGIYGSHAVFIGWIEEYDFPFMETAIWQFVYPVLVFACAWLASEALSRLPGMSGFCGRRRSKPKRLATEAAPAVLQG